jgi:hypothetical protein
MMTGAALMVRELEPGCAPWTAVCWHVMKKQKRKHRWLNGLPYKNWKRQTGFTEIGTMAAMAKRSLALLWKKHQECSLGWRFLRSTLR